MEPHISSSDTRAEWLSTFSRIARLLPQPSASYHANPLQARDRWQEEMKNILELYALASACYNEFAPANALPAELLSKTFEFLVWEQPKSVTSLMRVCRKWHSVALETASLWTKVSISGSEPVDTFLERSKGFPLHVVGYVAPEDVGHIKRLRQLFSPVQLLRLSTLEIDVEPGTEELILRIMNKDNCFTPSLEVLTISSTEREVVPWPAFFFSQAPRLGQISLSEVPFPWGVVGLPSLRSLKVEIDFDNEDFSVSCTLDNVLESLAAMPNLESLELMNCLPILSGDRIKGIMRHRIITMPSLKTLIMDGNGDAYYELWALLEVHPSADANLTMYDSTPSNIIATALSRHTRQLHSPSYPLLHIIQEYTNMRVHLTNLRASDGPSIRLDFETDSLEQAIPEVLRASPLEKVKQLRLQGDFDGVAFGDLVSLFTVATNLTQIDILDTSSAKLFCSLLLPPSTPSGEPLANTSMLFPSLVKIHIVHADLTVMHGFDTDIKQPVGIWFGLALALRKKVGHGLQCLVADGCKVQKGWAREWRGMVNKVIWDGVEGVRKTDNQGTEDG